MSIKEAILAFYYSKKAFNDAPSGSREETAFSLLNENARKQLREACGDFREYMRIYAHIEYLCDRLKWPILYANEDAIHYSINRKMNK